MDWWRSYNTVCSKLCHRSVWSILSWVLGYTLLVSDFHGMCSFYPLEGFFSGHLEWQVIEANWKALVEEGTNLESLNTGHPSPALSPDGPPHVELGSHFLETWGWWVKSLWRSQMPLFDLLFLSNLILHKPVEHDKKMKEQSKAGCTDHSFVLRQTRGFTSTQMSRAQVCLWNWSGDDCADFNVLRKVLDRRAGLKETKCEWAVELGSRKCTCRAHKVVLLGSPKIQTPKTTPEYPRHRCIWEFRQKPFRTGQQGSVRRSPRSNSCDSSPSHLGVIFLLGDTAQVRGEVHLSGCGIYLDLSPAVLQEPLYLVTIASRSHNGSANYKKLRTEKVQSPHQIYITSLQFLPVQMQSTSQRVIFVCDVA